MTGVFRYKSHTQYAYITQFLISGFAGARRCARTRGENAEEHGGAQHAGAAVMWLSVESLSRPSVLGARPHPRTAQKPTRSNYSLLILLLPPASHAALLTTFNCTFRQRNCTAAGRSCLYMGHDLREERLLQKLLQNVKLIFVAYTMQLGTYIFHTPPMQKKNV